MALSFFRSRSLASNPNRINEPEIDRADFRVFKFNNRPRPNNREKILIISCFSEFGCETVGCLYCIPRLVKRYPGRYIIGMGWYGREYLYRHLLDEFWEIDESLMWLRDRTYAFHHDSNNLKKIEEGAAFHGTTVPSVMLGSFAVSNICRTCGKSWNEWRNGSVECPACKSTNIINSVFGSAEDYKATAVKIPQPSDEMKEWARSIVPKKCVGIFARNRATYGRNLPSNFYAKLINLLKCMGYNPIWLGEKQSTLPCPCPDITDFSRDEQSRDLEKTLAIISQCEFTIQFWTASSRLSAIVGIPYILFESPEQIYCTGTNPGQEGKRLELMTFGPKKIVIAHYKRVLNDPENTLLLVDRAVNELNAGDCEDILGMVEDEGYIRSLKDKYYEEKR